MAVRYVDGTGAGSDTYTGAAAVFTSGTNGPKATLNGAEDIPVAAGDLIHVRPTTYRELLTCDVSGTAGNPIEYRGDYAGVNWPNPTHAIARITGSGDDQTATRANCVTATTKNYRSFTGFAFDTTTGSLVDALTNGTNYTLDKCFFHGNGTNYHFRNTGTGGNHTISNCFFGPIHASAGAIVFSHSVVVDNSGNAISNCIFLGGIPAIEIIRVGGVTVKNSVFLGRGIGIDITAAITVGQTITVNNCIFVGLAVGLRGTVSGEIVEDYNTFLYNATNRTNTATGANSKAYTPLFDPHWFFQMIYGGIGPDNPNQLVTPFDLASYSGLVNLAGTSPTTTDMRGTAVIGAQREWGPLEYDSTLQIMSRGGAGGMFMGNAINRSSRY